MVIKINLGSIKNKYADILRTINNAKLKLVLPERFKGTIVEKWATYWRSLGIDYRDVAFDVVKEIRTKPLKAAAYSAMIGTTYACIKNNPSEIDFIERIRYHNQNLTLVHESCLNPISSNHLKYLENSINEGTLRHLSIGILSVMWLDNYNTNVALYKAICPYTQVDYFKFHERIIDIGFWNKWYKLEEKMMDYDVNV